MQTTLLRVLAAMIATVVGSTSCPAQGHVEFINEGDDDVYVVVASKTGLVWKDNWDIWGWIKIPAGKANNIPRDSKMAFGFLNSRREVLTLGVVDGRTNLPERVREIKVHPTEPFRYELDSGDPGLDFVPMRMSFLLQGSEAREQVYTLKSDKASCGEPLRPTAHQIYLRAMNAYAGKGVKQDYAAAAEGFRAAAGQGHARACTMMGRLCASGRGVSKDVPEAVKWYTKAAEQGQPEAQAELGARLLAGEGIEKNEARAAAWNNKAAAKGNARAQSNLALQFATGRGVLKNTAESVRWYRACADAGEAECQVCLGRAYESGDGIPKSATEACRWFRKAADANSPLGQYYLARHYEKHFGEGVDWSLTDAARLYRKAANAGHAGAMVRLAEMYELGRGVEKSTEDALFWYKVAVSHGHAASKADVERLIPHKSE